MNSILKLLLLALMLQSATLSAQNGKITGKIIKSDQTAVEGIVISLIDSATEVLIKTEISDFEGKFMFESLPANNYVVAIDDAEYKSYESQLLFISSQGGEIILQNIVLTESEAINLEGVTIVKKLPFVERKLDKTIVNVDAMLSSAGSDAMEILEKAPGITVDQNGTITFKGKTGVSVFVDDKPTYLSGSQLEAYLKSLPAGMLSQIELMTNPPAKYEAAGNAGVINIKTKKSKSKGFFGSVSSRLSQGQATHSRNGVNLNYKNDKLRVYGNLNYASQRFLSELYIFRLYKNDDGTTKTLFHQDSDIDVSQNTANGRIGMDYYLSEKTTLGISFSGLSKTGTDKTKGRSRLTNAAAVLDSTIVANNREKNDFRNLGINLNFSRDFDSLGTKLTADMDLLLYADDVKQRFRNSIYYPDNSLVSNDASTGKLPSNINIYAFKTDYSKPLKHDGLFETGYKVSYSKTDNIAAYSDVLGNVEVPNYDTSNHFKYDEVVNAIYVNYNRSFGRLSLQSGLRLENTVSKGNQLGNIIKPASQFKNEYTNLFPTFYAMYKLDSIADKQLVFSYGRRIERPYYRDLNPFLSPLDKFTFYAGNPYLNPSFSDNFELSYRYKSLFSTTFSYARAKDQIDETIEIRDEIYYSRPGNIGKTETYSINVESEIPITKWYSASFYSELTNLVYKSKLYTETLDTNGTFFYFQINNKFTFAKSWAAEIFGSYISGIASGQVTTEPKGGVNFTIQKKILQEKGTLRFGVNDIFLTQINAGIINNLRNTYADYRNVGDTRYASLTFTYSFGKAFESKNSQPRSSAESEQNRVKN